jgi:hypothetical protein
VYIKVNSKGMGVSSMLKYVDGKRVDKIRKEYTELALI